MINKDLLTTKLTQARDHKADLGAAIINAKLQMYKILEAVYNGNKINQESVLLLLKNHADIVSTLPESIKYDDKEEKPRLEAATRVYDVLNTLMSGTQSAHDLCILLAENSEDYDNPKISWFTAIGAVLAIIMKNEPDFPLEAVISAL